MLLGPTSRLSRCFPWKNPQWLLNSVRADRAPARADGRFADVRFTAEADIRGTIDGDREIPLAGQRGTTMRYDPAYWRQRAEEIRATAQQLADADAKETLLLKIADDYERLAERAMARLQSAS
jgi:hypothetical protein